MKATIFRATDTHVDLARFWRLLASRMWHLAVSSVHITIWKECAVCFIIAGGECRYSSDNTLLHCRALWFSWILLWNPQIFFPVFILWTFWPEDILFSCNCIWYIIPFCTSTYFQVLAMVRLRKNKMSV